MDEYLKQVIDNAPNFIFWKDLNSMFIGCNKNFATSAGLKHASEIVGKTDYDLPWASDAESYIKDDKVVINSGKAKLNIEESQTTKDGKVITLLTSKVPLRDSNGSICGVIGLYSDITTLKLAQQRAESANKVKSEFIENMSHDLRTPIVGILGVTQVLLNQAKEAHSYLRADAIKDALKLLMDIQVNGELVIGASNELLDLSNEVLEIMNLEAGNIKEEMKPFNVRKSVDKIYDLLMPVAINKNLAFNKSINFDVPQELVGYQTYFQRTLINLLSNALKFTNKGHVSVSVKVLDDGQYANNELSLLITVEDSGIGISEDKFDVIFEHFSRLNPSFEGVYKGAGLGLYTVKQYVKTMKGEIAVDSIVGKGSCFTVTVPFVLPVNRSLQYEPRLSSSSNQLNSQVDYSKLNISVLVVEDNKLAMIAIKSLLQEFQCVVDAAETGAQAVNQAKNSTYDLILMDIGLPDFDGIEVARRIRSLEDELKANVPIIALTAHASNSTQCQKALALGIQEVVSKPVQLLALESIFRRYVLKVRQFVDDIDQDARQSETAENMKFLQPIDWEASVRKCSNYKELTYEILGIFFNELPNYRDKLERFYAAGEITALCDEVHSICEGMSYLELPQLDFAFNELYGAMMPDSKSPVGLEEAYSNVLFALDTFAAKWTSGGFEKGFIQ